MPQVTQVLDELFILFSTLLIMNNRDKDAYKAL